MRSFLLGVLTVLLIIFVGGYLFITTGGVSMKTSASPLPLEATVAEMAIRASMGNARDQKNPVPADDQNLLAGADTYRNNCAVCHGTPGRPASLIAKGMFPPPPQLFEKEEMVTDDPEGNIYWLVTNGIRLSGMPGFDKQIPDTQRWQVTALVAHADKLPPAVTQALMK
jgi:thiosulfate dehydrogenase